MREKGEVDMKGLPRQLDFTREILVSLARSSLTAEHDKLYAAFLAESIASEPSFAAVHEAIVAAGRPAQMEAQGIGESVWIQSVLDACIDDTVRSYVRQLISRPLPVDQVNERYATSLVARLLELDTLRQTQQLQGKLSRMQASDETDASDQSDEIMRQLSGLEGYRRELRSIVQGEQ